MEPDGMDSILLRQSVAKNCLRDKNPEFRKTKRLEFLEEALCLLPSPPSVDRLLLSSNPDRYWTQKIGYDRGLTSLERLGLPSLRPE